MLLPLPGAHAMYTITLKRAQPVSLDGTTPVQSLQAYQYHLLKLYLSNNIDIFKGGQVYDLFLVLVWEQI